MDTILYISITISLLTCITTYFLVNSMHKKQIRIIKLFVEIPKSIISMRYWKCEKMLKAVEYEKEVDHRESEVDELKEEETEGKSIEDQQETTSLFLLNPFLIDPNKNNNQNKNKRKYSKPRGTLASNKIIFLFLTISCLIMLSYSSITYSLSKDYINRAHDFGTFFKDIGLIAASTMALLNLQRYINIYIYIFIYTL